MAAIGDQLAGRYRLDALIGSGGYAVVFRAHDLRLHRDVAVKVLLANHATDPVLTSRFDREARVLAAINHANVVAIHDVEAGDPATGAEPFIVMELCTGGSLADQFVASGTGTLTPALLIPILVDVTAGLGALHAQGITHRDLKPSNILLSDGRARIADLGIAIDGPSDLTVSGTALGTLGYLAPEQLEGRPGSAATDCHAVGVVAFEGLTGRLPRPAGNVAELVVASRGPVEPVSALRPDLGTAFDAPIAGALSVEPSQRPTAIELGAGFTAALERWQEGPPTPSSEDDTTRTGMPLPVVPVASAVADDGPAAATPTPAAFAERRHSVRRPILWVATLAAILVLVAAVFIALRPSGLAGAGRGDEASPSDSVAATPTATVAVTDPPSASPTASARPTPMPTVDVYEQAGAASREMRIAIAAAKGGRDGLKGKDAKTLEDTLGRFERALAQRDPTAARKEAAKVAAQVARLIDRRAVGAREGDRLSAAATGLVESADALPA